MLCSPDFRDRADAGRQLVARLAHIEDKDVLVLGLPRGGIPVAAEIARSLGVPLEPMFVRKIGAPKQPEFAVGAVANGVNPVVILNEQATRLPGCDDTYLRNAVRAKLDEIERRKQVYLGSAKTSDPSGRKVVLVDDGIATGSTVKAALAVLKRRRPRRLILAVPVLPRASVPEFAAEVDELVYLRAPAWFGAVGEHYCNFDQVSDDTVCTLLAQSRCDLDRSLEEPFTPNKAQAQ